MTSTRLGVPIYSLQVSCVSMKFENFDRRSFHIDTVNFVTYDLTSLDLDERLLKRYNLHFFLNHRLRSREIHDTAGRRDDTFRVGLFAYHDVCWKKKDVSVILYFRNTKIRGASADQFEEVKKNIISKKKELSENDTQRIWSILLKVVSRTRYQDDSIWTFLRKNIKKIYS